MSGLLVCVFHKRRYCCRRRRLLFIVVVLPIAVCIKLNILLNNTLIIKDLFGTKDCIQNHTIMVKNEGENCCFHRPSQSFRLNDFIGRLCSSLLVGNTHLISSKIGLVS